MSPLSFSLLLCALLAAGIVLCAYLFLSLKQELRLLRKRHLEQTELADHTAGQLRSEIAHLKQAFVEVERKASQLPQLSPPKPAMNTTRRSQILRMHRRGEGPDQIAAALGVPKGEIDLLLKIDQAARTA